MSTRVRLRVSNADGGGRSIDTGAGAPVPAAAPYSNNLGIVPGPESDGIEIRGQ